MKKLLSILTCILFALIVFTPLCVLACWLVGYKFALVQPGVFAYSIFVLTAITVAASVFSKEIIENKIISILVCVMTPCALLNIACFIRSCGALWIVAGVLTAVGCGYLTIRHGKPTDVKTGGMVLSAGMLLPMALICFVLFVAGKTQNYVVLDTVDSPTGTYYAEVIDNDQAEKGGWKLVHVYPNNDIETPFFVAKKKPHKMYEEYYNAGEGDLKTVVVQWIDDTHLTINGENYSIS